MSLFFSLHKNTVLSIVDGRVQQYVSQRHHKIFYSPSNVNSPSHSSATAKSKHFMNHHQERTNKHTLINTTKTITERLAFFIKYKKSSLINYLY